MKTHIATVATGQVTHIMATFSTAPRPPFVVFMKNFQKAIFKFIFIAGGLSLQFLAFRPQFVAFHVPNISKQYGPKRVRHQRIPTMDPIARALPFFGSMRVEDILVLWQFETNTPVGVVVSMAVDVWLWCRVVGVVVGNCVEAKKRCKVAGKETCNVQQNKQDMQTCRGANMQMTQKTAN